jgi:hypothetical protein
MNKPFVISVWEWREIMEVTEVKEAWGLDGETAEEFASMVYGVKFRFQSGSPGYLGDLFIIQADVLAGDPPWVLTRDRQGRLRVEGSRSLFPERCREAL